VTSLGSREDNVVVRGHSEQVGMSTPESETEEQEEECIQAMHAMEDKEHAQLHKMK
jgi:hypothetical protein